MSNLKQLKCPNCGASLKQDSPNQLIVECPYCHQQVVNDTYHLSGKSAEPHVLEFRMTENEVLEQMINQLIGNRNVPTDIFDKMKITSIEKYYVPMYVFEGSFRAPWTARKERQERRQRIGRDGKIEDYYETLYDYYNGEEAGNFSVNGIPSSEMSRLNLSPESVQRIVFNPSQLSPFSAVQISGKDRTEILTSSSEGDSVWWESGESDARNVAYSRVPGDVTSCSASCELKKTSFVYIPLWIIRYEYNENTFSSIYYAEQYLDLTSPKGVNIEAQPTEEQQLVLDNYKKRDGIISNIRNIGCLGIILIGFIGCWKMDEYKSKHYLDYNYNGEDGGTFLWKMFFVGIVLLVIISIIRYLFRRKDGIDNIENDIANRTNILQHEADNYRHETGKRFLNSKVGLQDQTYFDNSTETEFANPTPLYEANPSKTKTCVRCSKQIDVHHMFCRYCGAKQN